MLEKKYKGECKMLWIIKGDFSHQIVSCNIFEEGDMYQLWVTRPNGKNLKLEEKADKAEIVLIKEAIDYAIEHGEPVLRLN